MRSEFGFDKAPSAGLAEKLSALSQNERRGFTMFDEIQVSKNTELQPKTGKSIGMVDFGNLTTGNLTTDVHTKEANHALIFLFQPLLGGWVQTIGFCFAATTLTAGLTKLILQAITLLANCGAVVKKLVCDGASTNAAA